MRSNVSKLVIILFFCFSTGTVDILCLSNLALLILFCVEGFRLNLFGKKLKYRL